MKKRNIIFYLVWLIVLVIFQPTFMQWIRIFGVSPDMFLIFIICVGLFRSKGESAIVGFIFGFIFDFMVGRSIGISAILYMYLGLFTGIVKERFISDRGSIAALMILLASLFGGIIYYVCYYISWGDLNFGWALIHQIIPKAIYTAVLGFALFVPIMRSFGLTKDTLF